MFCVDQAPGLKPAIEGITRLVGHLFGEISWKRVEACCHDSGAKDEAGHRFTGFHVRVLALRPCCSIVVRANRDLFGHPRRNGAIQQQALLSPAATCRQRNGHCPVSRSTGWRGSSGIWCAPETHLNQVSGYWGPMTRMWLPSRRALGSG